MLYMLTQNTLQIKGYVSSSNMLNPCFRKFVSLHMMSTLSIKLKMVCNGVQYTKVFQKQFPRLCVVDPSKHFSCSWTSSIWPPSSTHANQWQLLSPVCFFVVCILPFRSNHIQIWKKKKWDEWGRVFKWVHYKRWCEQTQRTTSNQMKCIPSLEALPTRNTRDQWIIFGQNPFQCISTQTKSIWRGNWQGDFIPPKITRENERSMSIIRS